MGTGLFFEIDHPSAAVVKRADRVNSCEMFFQDSLSQIDGEFHMRDDNENVCVPGENLDHTESLIDVSAMLIAEKGLERLDFFVPMEENVSEVFGCINSHLCV